VCFGLGGCFVLSGCFEGNIDRWCRVVGVGFLGARLHECMDFGFGGVDARLYFVSYISSVSMVRC